MCDFQAPLLYLLVEPHITDHSKLLHIEDDILQHINARIWYSRHNMAAKNLPVQAGMVFLPSPSALALGARIKMKVMSKILVIISFDL